MTTPNKREGKDDRKIHGVISQRQNVPYHRNRDRIFLERNQQLFPVIVGDTLFCNTLFISYGSHF
jgi:hypothetical protein